MVNSLPFAEKLPDQFQKMLLSFSDGIIEAGCDEAGRGCLAGPVVAGAVILPPGFEPSLVNDSKKLTADQREEAADIIRKHAIAWAVGVVDNHEIDKINILRASIKAMHIALDKLKRRPKFILVDGNYFIPYRKVKHKCIVEGDALYAPIAAASIMAKTYRDRLMVKLHKQYPHYGWKANKGYGTPEHYAAINATGISPLHRRSYRPIQEAEQLELSFSKELAV